MVIFDFKVEGTGTYISMLPEQTSKCVPSGIVCRLQHFCQVSIALLEYWPRCNLVPRVLSLPRERTLVMAGHVSMHANPSHTKGGSST